MDIKQLPIYNEIKNVFSKAKAVQPISYTVVVNSVVGEVDVIITESIDIIRDYGNNIGDYIFCILKVGLGTYHREIFPYRDNLEATLVKTNSDGSIETKRYKLVLNNDAITPEGGVVNLASKDELNIMTIITIEVQLIDVYIEVVRSKIVSGIYRNTTVEDVMRAVITAQLNNILVDSKPFVNQVDIATASNTDVLPHIILKDGVKLTRLANTLQSEYGVYTADIGFYLQRYNNKNTCFVYPLFDYERFNNNTNINKLIITAIPGTRYELNDRTYMIEGSTLRIVVGDSSFMTHDGEKEFSDKGVGFKSIDSRVMMSKPTLVEESGPVGVTSQTTYKVVHKDKADGLNYAPVKGIGKNVYTHYSEIMRRSGAILTATWRVSDPDLIYPGMPMMYVYTVGDDVRHITGIVQHTHTVTSTETPASTLISAFLLKR